MTWAEGIALAAGVFAGLLIIRDQNKHRSNTEQHTDPQDGTGERP